MVLTPLGEARSALPTARSLAWPATRSRRRCPRTSRRRTGAEHPEQPGARLREQRSRGLRRRPGERPRRRGRSGARDALGRRRGGGGMRRLGRSPDWLNSTKGSSCCSARARLTCSSVKLPRATRISPSRFVLERRCCASVASRSSALTRPSRRSSEPRSGHGPTPAWGSGLRSSGARTTRSSATISTTGGRSSSSCSVSASTNVVDSALASIATAIASGAATAKRTGTPSAERTSSKHPGPRWIADHDENRSVRKATNRQCAVCASDVFGEMDANRNHRIGLRTTESEQRGGWCCFATSGAIWTLVTVPSATSVSPRRASLEIRCSRSSPWRARTPSSSSEVNGGR